MQDDDKTFAGSIPEIYDAYLVPLIFEPYAIDIAARIAKQPPSQLLELAAGTGAVTRRLAFELPASTSIVATDLNQPMIDRANSIGATRPVTWRQADALQLPFPDASFDCVVCQFGVMFFPDKPRALAEARRVLNRAAACCSTPGIGSRPTNFPRRSALRSPGCFPTIRPVSWRVCRTATSTTTASGVISRPVVS